MKRAIENELNKSVIAGLKEKGIESPEAVIIGYKLGHKYLDHGIKTALPTILEKIAEATDLNYRVVSRMVYKVIPTKAKETKETKTATPRANDFGGRYVYNPFKELLADYKVK